MLGGMQVEDRYFATIQPSFRQRQVWRLAVVRANSKRAATEAALARLSLIAVVALVASSLLVGEFRPHALSIAIYGTLMIGTVGLLASPRLARWLHSYPPQPPVLSPLQESFAACLNSAQAIERLKVARLEQDANEARAGVQLLQQASPWELSFAALAWQSGVASHVAKSAAGLGVTEDVLRRMDALATVAARVQAAIDSREDLDVAENALRNLALFLYTQLAKIDLQIQPSQLMLANRPFEALDRLADALSGLPRPATERPEDPSAQSRRSRALALVRRQRDILAFVRWWALISVLCLAITVPVHVILSLSDDTIALLLIGTPIAGAATLAIATRRSSDS